MRGDDDKRGWSGPNCPCASSPFLLDWFRSHESLLQKEKSVRVIGHETSGLRRQAIDRSGCGDVKRTVVVVAPREVGRLFRHLDRPQMLTLRIPDPDAFRAGHKQISFIVNLDTVRNPFVL